MIGRTFIDVERKANVPLRAHRLDHLIALEQPLKPGISSPRLLAPLTGLESADKFLLLGDICLLLLVGTLLREFDQLALLHERGIIPLEAVEPGIAQPQNPRRKPIQKKSVMA